MWTGSAYRTPMTLVGMLFALARRLSARLDPVRLLLTRLAGKGDIRDIGSGNIGATNVLRTGSKGLAAATLLLDVAKGAAAVWSGAAFLARRELHAAAGALIGHLYPLWLSFAAARAWRPCSAS